MKVFERQHYYWVTIFAALFNLFRIITLVIIYNNCKLVFPRFFKMETFNYRSKSLTADFWLRIIVI